MWPVSKGISSPLAKIRYPRSVTTRGQKQRFTREYNKALAQGLSPNYARRIARGFIAGKTRQEARGKKAGEHIIRKEREKAKLGGTTADQLKIIERWYKKIFNPKGYREIPTLPELIAWVKKNGYDAFKLYREVWEPVHREYKKEEREGIYVSRGWPFLEIIWGTSGVAATGEPIEWLYYH